MKSNYTFNLISLLLFFVFILGPVNFWFFYLFVLSVCLSVCPFKRLMNMNIDHDFLFFHNFVIIQSVLSVSLANHMLII